jgi:hypothetical protein
MQRYLTSQEMDALIDHINSLDTNKWRYISIYVDGEWHLKKSLNSVCNFLSACIFPRTFRVFRNASGGVTIDLDLDHYTSDMKGIYHRDS